jgi:hypothetical protein
MAKEASAFDHQSIVDFLKQKKLDASRDARAELYARFVDESEKYIGTARQNVTLLRAVIEKQDLLDQVTAAKPAGDKGETAKPAAPAKPAGDKGETTEKPAAKPAPAEGATITEPRPDAPTAPAAPEQAPETKGDELLKLSGKHLGKPFDTLAVRRANGTYALKDGEGRYVWQRDGKVTLYDKGASGGNAAANQPGKGVTFVSELEPLVCIDLLWESAVDAGLTKGRKTLPNGGQRQVAQVEPYLQSLDTTETIQTSGATFENISSGKYKFPPLKKGDMIFLQKPGARHSGIVSEVDADGQPTMIRYVNSENKTGDFPLMAEQVAEDAPTTHVPGSGFMFPKNRVTSIIRAK